MKWRLVDDEGSLSGHLNKEDEVKDVVSVEFIFDDGVPTGVVIELKGTNNLIHVCSRQVDPDGCREGLCVTTTEEEIN